VPPFKLAVLASLLVCLADSSASFAQAEPDAPPPARQPLCPNVPSITKATPFPQKAIDMNIRNVTVTIAFDVAPGGEIRNVKIQFPTREAQTAFADTAVTMIKQLQCVNPADTIKHVNWPIDFRLQ
jgi:hypothetical protein